MSTAIPEPDRDVPEGTASADQTEPRTVPGSGGRRTPVVWPVLAVGFALLSAVLAFLLLRPEEEAQGFTTSAGSTVELACEILEEVDTSAADLATTEGRVTHSQLAVVGTLGWLAHTHDDSYEQVWNDLQAPGASVSRYYTMEGEEFDAAMDRAHGVCEDLRSE